MTTGLILHLSGPLQHWGGPQGGRARNSFPHPTRSALTGLIAAAQGRPRGSDNSDLDRLIYTVRVDRPGSPLRDFHTVGGGRPASETVPTADGKRRGNALIFEDGYRSDAAYTVAVTGPADTIREAADALARPVYPPHLGRRNCPPDSPVLLAVTDDDPVSELLRIPLHRSRPWGGEPVQIKHIHEKTPEGQVPPTRDIRDVPLPGRRFALRPLWETLHDYPAERCAGLGGEWIAALTGYRSAAA